MWESVEWPDRPHMAIQYGAGKVRFACRITEENTHTHTHTHTQTQTHTI